MNKKYLILTISIQLTSVLFFCYGYFPLKSVSHSYASNSSDQDILNELLGNPLLESNLSTDCVRRHTTPLAPAFSRLVLVVIDAWRYEFLWERSSMTWIRSKITSGQGVAFNARCQPPTVTMPRLKALLAGTVPVFLDVMFNLASPELKVDNLLYQLKTAKKRIQFYGDDTWLKMFPSTVFDRAEGVTSFYVNDFTQVDNNVTRHLTHVLDKRNVRAWDVLILHYLGLDHIGHALGPFSKEIPNKLVEMDRVVERIYNSLSEVDNDFIMVVLGDHGMSDSGSHGGASRPETEANLVFLSPKLASTNIERVPHKVDQVDVVPTIASLMGCPVPMENVGVLIDDVIYRHDVTAKMPYLNSMLLNLYQMDNVQNLKILKSVNGKALIERHKSCIAMVCRNDTFFSKQCGDLISLYRKNLHEIKINLMANLTEYSVMVLLVAVVVLSVTTGVQCRSQAELFWQLYSVLYSNISFSTTFAATVLFVHPLIFVSSSFVEEEHYFWNFVYTTLLFLICFDCARNRKNNNDFVVTTYYFTALVALNRVKMSWIRTGVKWLHLADISDWLSTPENQVVRLIVFVVALLVVFFILDGQPRFFVAMQMGLVAGYHFLVAFPTVSVSGTTLARIVYTLNIAYVARFGLISSMRVILMVTLLLIGRTVNTALLVVMLGEVVTLSHLLDRGPPVSACSRATIVYVLGMTMYFGLGNSNSLSNIDISVGYVGLDSYQPGVVGLLILISTYGMPFIAIMYCFHNTMCMTGEIKVQVVSTLVGVKFWATWIYFVVAFIQRYHLFVWSVFAPKILFESAHCFVLSVLSILYLIFNC